MRKSIQSTLAAFVAGEASTSGDWLSAVAPAAGLPVSISMRNAVPAEEWRRRKRGDRLERLGAAPAWHPSARLGLVAGAAHVSHAVRGFQTTDWSIPRPGSSAVGVVEAMASDGGLDGVEPGALSEVLKQLSPRWFAIRNVHHTPSVALLQTRTTLSWMRGPMTRADVKRLVAGR